METRKATFQRIRAELKVLVEQAQSAQAQRRDTKQDPKSPDRSDRLHWLWQDKIANRPRRRRLTLALAYLKGRAYIQCEHHKATSDWASRELAYFIADILVSQKSNEFKAMKEVVTSWVKGEAIKQAEAA